MPRPFAARTRCLATGRGIPGWPSGPGRPETGRAAAARPAAHREPTPQPQPPGASLPPESSAMLARRRAASSFSSLPGQPACPRTSTVVLRPADWHREKCLSSAADSPETLGRWTVARCGRPGRSRVDGPGCAQYHHDTVDEPAVRGSGLPVGLICPVQATLLRRLLVPGQKVGTGARRRIFVPDDQGRAGGGGAHQDRRSHGR